MQESVVVTPGEMPPARRTGRRPAGSAPPSSGQLEDPRALQILTTEHWSLLSARALVYNEAFSRAGMFLSFLSMSFVAIGLAGPAMSFSHDFLILAAIVLFVDLVVGLATFGRIVDARDEDLRAILGMNRIRHGYVEMVPAIATYLITSVHDDMAGVAATYGGADRRGLGAVLHGLTTTSGMVGLVVSLIAGALAGVVVLAAGGSIVVSLAAALPAAGVTFTAVGYADVRSLLRVRTSLPSRFPTPTEANEPLGARELLGLGRRRG